MQMVSSCFTSSDACTDKYTHLVAFVMRHRGSVFRGLVHAMAFDGLQVVSMLRQGGVVAQMWTYPNGHMQCTAMCAMKVANVTTSC